MKTRHHYPILLIALLLGLMGFAEHAQADYTLGHYTRVEADNNTIKLAWTKTTGSQGTMSLQFRYRVRWRESGYSTWKEKTTTDLNFTINGSYNTMYEVEVISEAIYGTGGGSYGVRKVSTIADKEEPKPGGYVDGYPKAVSPTEIEVKWNLATDNITKQKDLVYSVYWTRSGSPWDVGGRYDVGGEGTFLRIADLEPNTEYLVDVVVEDKARNQARYGKHTIKTPPAADTEAPHPGHFVLGYPKAISPTEIEVKWTLATDEGGTAQENLRYQVKCIRHSDGETVKTSPELTNQTEYTITGLEPETEYRIQITVWDEANNSEGYGDPIVKTPAADDTEKPKPGDYVDGYPKAISPTEIVVKWNKATDNVTAQEDLKYQVLCILFHKAVATSPVLTDKTEYTLTGLEPDTEYLIRVDVEDKAGNTARYSVKTVKTPAAETPEPKPEPKPEPGPGEAVLVSSITLDQPKVSIDGDRKSFQLKASVLPANATNSELQWSSSNPSVASVEASSMASLLKAGVTGKAVTVHIHKKGKAEITAQAMDGSGKSASCQVNVLSTVGNIEAAATRIYALGSTLRLTLPQAAVVRIYNVSGALVHMLNASAGDTSVALSAGVYVVRVGDTVQKVRIE